MTANTIDVDGYKNISKHQLKFNVKVKKLKTPLIIEYLEKTRPHLHDLADDFKSLVYRKYFWNLDLCYQPRVIKNVRGKLRVVGE